MNNNPWIRFNEVKLDSKNAIALGTTPKTIRFNIKCRTLEDMTPIEVLGIEKHYGYRVANRYQWGLL